MNPSNSSKALRPPERPKLNLEPDGKLGVFLIHTPTKEACVRIYERSATFRQLQADLESGELQRRHPNITDGVTLDVEMKGAKGQKILEEATAAWSTKDGDFEIPEEDPELAEHIYRTFRTQYGPDKVFLDPHSLPLPSMQAAKLEAREDAKALAQRAKELADQALAAAKAAAAAEESLKLKAEKQTDPNQQPKQHEKK